jgi:dehydrogenase/reductase SDR family member 7B
MRQNTTVWITGASSGIGEALAKEYARQGADLILSARRREELERVKGLCGLPDDRCLVLPLDVADHGSLPAAAKVAVAWRGQVDVLVNNAGISQRARAVDTSLPVEKRLFDINYFGTVELTRLLLPHFLHRHVGHIVVISSVVGKLGTPIRTSYAASKHALHGYFDSLRAELDGTGISVSIVCPGYIRTQVSVNAVGPDGSRYGKMDVNQEKGMDADVFARKAVRALDKKKPEIWIGGIEVVGIWLSKFAPWLLRRILAKRQGG